MEEFGPAAGVKGGVAEGVEEVCASFHVRVGDLHFRWEEGGKVAMEVQVVEPNCMRAGEMRVQSARGSLVRSSDLGRMLRSWSVMRFKGTYL